MKRSTGFWLIGVFAAAVAVLLFLTRNVPLSGQNPPAGAPTLREQSSLYGGVLVTVAPADPASGETWDFRVSLSTHAGDLNQDLTKIAELKDDQGRTYRPVGWQGAPPGGHHVSGVLKFPKPNPVPPSFQLTVRQVEGLDRTFTWRLTR